MDALRGLCRAVDWDRITQNDTDEGVEGNSVGRDAQSANIDDFEMPDSSVSTGSIVNSIKYFSCLCCLVVPPFQDGTSGGASRKRSGYEDKLAANYNRHFV